ncbi:MAG: hypothetical protein Q4D04_03125 [Clostridia bacterium]|nr:hypothetical protein [Clostridia bacterium]
MKMAVLVANRGFFPSSVIEQARSQLTKALTDAGIEPIMIDENKVRYGAVETTLEGMVYHDFLEQHHGEYDGLIISLPNFGDENGIKAAIKDVNVPILLQAYPDEIGHMDFEHRRDAFCGKLGLGSVLKQMGTRFTSFPPFTVHPLSEEFASQLKKFKAICRIVKRMKHMRLGAIGARTTAFKSVRYDEIALERHGIDVETVDLSAVFAIFESIEGDAPEAVKWLDYIKSSVNFGEMPAGKDVLLARLGATFETIINTMKLDCVAIRCWDELEKKYGIAPCCLLGILNHMGIPAACELDVTNAIAMMALSLASEGSAGLLDWNNNYGDEPDKCILFHCGPLAMDLMTGKGTMQQHLMFAKTYGNNSGWGLNVDKIVPGEITFSSVRNEDGRVEFYVGNAEITDDEIEPAFFGTPGVLTAPNLQSKLQNIFEGGFRHHVAITRGDVAEAVTEALTKYLGYTKVDI